MKKALVIILALIFILSISSFAGSEGATLGAIPQLYSAANIVIDGVKDDFYDQGLILPLTRPLEEGQNDYGTHGTAWSIFKDGILYIIVQVIDLSIVEPTPEQQSGNPWNCDSVEVFIAPNNTDVTTEVIQYRIDVTGWPCYYTVHGGGADNIALYGPEAVGDKFQYAHRRVGTQEYWVEYAIPIENGKTEGYKFGFQFQINDPSDLGSQVQVMSPSSASSRSWTPELYDFATVGALIPEPVVIVEEVEEPAAEVGTPSVTPPSGGAAQTSDVEFAMFIAIGLISLAGAVLLVKKSRK
ncbi:MAG: hypothetical protein FWF15_04050 [Oscillospiraceae bacterium]|nr:hypothetical protein [Oscillospiraceae bacterium]